MKTGRLLVLMLAVVVGWSALPVPGAPVQAQPYAPATPTITPIPLGSPGDSGGAPQSDTGEFTTLSVQSQPVIATVGVTRQEITIETPGAGTRIGSPIVVTGRTASPTDSGQLAWVMRDVRGFELGFGSFAVSADLRFNASLDFVEPPDQSELVLELYDASGSRVLARSSVRLVYLPPAALVVRSQVVQPQAGQRVIIETPLTGTRVGSPMVTTGRVVDIPAGGLLYWHIRDGRGVVLGAGRFRVFVTRQGVPRFNASLNFEEPRVTTGLVLEIQERTAAGRIISASVRQLTFLPPGALPRGRPPAGPALPFAPAGFPQAAAVPPSAGTASFFTPAPGARVSSPLVMIGRMNRLPAGQILYWRMRDANGMDLGSGQFYVYPTAELPAAFQVELNFERPTRGTGILLELYEVTDTRRVRVAANARLVYGGP